MKLNNRFQPETVTNMKMITLAVLCLALCQGCATAGGAVMGGAAGTLFGATVLQAPTEVNTSTGEETTPPFDKEAMFTSAIVGAAVGGLIGMIIDLSNASEDSPSDDGGSSFAEGVSAFTNGVNSAMDQDLINQCSAQGMVPDFNTRRCVYQVYSGGSYSGGGGSNSTSSSTEPSEHSGGRGRCYGLTDYQCSSGYARGESGAVYDEKGEVQGELRHVKNANGGYDAYVGHTRTPERDITGPEGRASE